MARTALTKPSPYTAANVKTNYDANIDATNANDLELMGARTTLFGTAAPTTGAHSRGDICWNTTPSAAGVPGWICTAAGTPGTWNAMANLAA